MSRFLFAVCMIGIAFLLAYLIIRAAAGEVHPDSAILIDEPEFHQTSAIICNRAIPPQVRPYKGVTFA